MYCNRFELTLSKYDPSSKKIQVLIKVFEKIMVDKGLLVVNYFR